MSLRIHSKNLYITYLRAIIVMAPKIMLNLDSMINYRIFTIKTIQNTVCVSYIDQIYNNYRHILMDK